MRRGLALLGLLCLLAPAGAGAKGPARLLLVGADGRARELVGVDLVAGWADADGVSAHGGYFLVYGAQIGVGERLRYHPAARALCSWWPGARPHCGRVDPRVARRLAAVRLTRFRVAPTVITNLALNGIAQSSWIEINFELALNRWAAARPAHAPRRCLLAYSAGWSGPKAAARPRHLCLLRRGVYAAGRLYPAPYELARIAEGIFGPDGSLTESP